MTTSAFFAAARGIMRLSFSVATLAHGHGKPAEDAETEINTMATAPELSAWLTTAKH